MSDSIRIEVDDAQAQAKLARLLAAGRDLTPAMDKLGFALSSLARDQFDRGMDPWGKAWAPLSIVTLRRRRKASDLPLRNTGELMDSVRAVADKSSVTLSIGKAKRPATPHQFGNPNNRMFGKALAPIPARAIFPIRPGSDRLELPGEWSEVTQDALTDLLDSAIK